MKITELIDRNVHSISVLEDTRDLAGWLKEKKYYAVVDEEQHTAGIITIGDLFNDAARNIIDCNFIKPWVTPDQTIIQVLGTMKESGYDFLPVYDAGTFIGVISLLSLTEKLENSINDDKLSYQRVVHDLRNPLFNIQGLITLLHDLPGGQENLDILSLCSLSCKHAIDILEDLLLVEVYESKPLSLVQTEMNYFYNQCVQEQKGLSLLKNIKIVTDLSTEPVIRNIDRNHFKRAVQNVIANAVKFSYPESTIKISSKIENDKLILKIGDAGVGIPAHLQPEIFKKFTKAQRPGTGGEASTGLGLCFSKQCIEQHNGTIHFKSIEGQGSKFYISL